MRLILTTIILTMLAQPVWATTNGLLYKSCKPFADRAFTLDPDTYVNHFKDGLCAGYISAAIEQAHHLCSSLSTYREFTSRYDGNIGDAANLGHQFASKLYGTSATVSDLDAVIQAFVNWAATNPQMWDATPNTSLWLSNLFHCKE